MVAGYRALFPYYGLEEVEPDKRQAPARNGPSARRQARTPAFVGRFLADMGVSRSTVQWLRANGHDAVHPAKIAMQRAADVDILALANRESRVVLTFDLDFGNILAASRGVAPSVIVFRISNARPERVNAHLESVLGDAAVIGDLVGGAIVVVEDERRRWRKLPIA